MFALDWAMKILCPTVNDSDAHMDPVTESESRYSTKPAIINQEFTLCF